VGLSTHLDDVLAPDIKAVALRRKRPAYRIEDMAADLLGLIDALGLDRVHLGGGLDGRLHRANGDAHPPDHVLSQTLMMTSTGSLRVGQTKPALISRLARGRRAMDREQAIEAAAEDLRLDSSRTLLFDEVYLRELAGRSYDRSHDARGYLRQLSAVLAQANRIKASPPCRSRRARADADLLHPTEGRQSSAGWRRGGWLKVPAPEVPGRCAPQTHQGLMTSWSSCW